MSPPTGLLGRALVAILSLAPFLASTDLCTIGAVTGHRGLACAMEVPAAGAQGASVAAACDAAAPAPCCAGCAAPVPERPAPRPHGPTCCDLRPQATGTGEPPAPVAPRPAAHPVAAIPAVSPAGVPASPMPVAPDDGRAPPRDLPPPAAPRAPPLG